MLIMDNKLNKMLEEFFAKNDVKDIKEANEKLQEFILKYNAGMIDYENSPLDDAYELLNKATAARNVKDAKRFAEQAYKKSKACVDAAIFLADIEENFLEKEKILNEAIEYEKKRLEKEKYFGKDNIGDFYGLFETRPYIRALYFKADLFLLEGKIGQAMNICKEILRLNEHDNTGARYVLMAIYAYFENEEEMLKLYKQYNEDNLEMLFPLFILYYKLGDDKKAIKYLDMINKENPHFVKFFKGNIKQNDKLIPGTYSMGDSSEVLMYFDKYDFLISTVITIRDFVLEHSKNKKTK